MLIIYTSKHGYTLQLAERMFNFGNGRNKLFNISSADDFQMENEEKLCILFMVPQWVRL